MATDREKLKKLKDGIRAKRQALLFVGNRLSARKPRTRQIEAAWAARPKLHVPVNPGHAQSRKRKKRGETFQRFDPKNALRPGRNLVRQPGFAGVFANVSNSHPAAGISPNDKKWAEVMRS